MSFLFPKAPTPPPPPNPAMPAPKTNPFSAPTMPGAGSFFGDMLTGKKSPTAKTSLIGGG